MTEIPSCSYECDRPECIRAQRDELVSRMTAETSNARGSCYEGVCPDCNSLDCDCDAPLPSRRPAMSGKPIPEEAVAQVCDRMLTAAIGKDWRKRAPEAVTAFWMGEVREALQEVVPALTAAQQQGQESGGEVIQRHVVTKYRDGSVHVADVATPPIAPVGVDMERFREPVVLWGKAYEYDRHGREAVVERRKPIVDELLSIIDAALAQQPAAVDEAMDTRCMDWLERHAVEVRTPMRYGSAALFHAEQVSDDDEPYRTNLRAQVAEALAAQHQEPKS